MNKARKALIIGGIIILLGAASFIGYKMLASLFSDTNSSVSGAELSDSQTSLSLHNIKVNELILQVVQRLQAAANPQVQVKKSSLSGYSTSLVRIDDQGKIQVYIKVKAANISSSTLDSIEAVGNVKIENREVALSVFQGYATIQAWVPYNKINDVAALPSVYFIDRPEYASQ